MAKWVEKGSLQGPPGEIPDVSDFLRDGDVSSAISGSSDKVASDKAVKDYVDSVNSALDGKISEEATSRQEQDEVLLGQISGKANVEHSHETNDVTGLQDALDSKASLAHTHSTSDVTGLDGALAGKSDTGHKHVSNDVTDLNDKLDAKANVTHTHDAGDLASGTLSIDRIPTIPDSKIGEVSAEKITGTIPSENLPSYVDDVIEADDYDALPPTGEAGKIYVDKETNKTYRWGGSAYVEISASLALGETSATAFRGDYGKTAYDHAQAKGSEFATGLYKITTNAEGHVISATAVAKGDITALGIPSEDTDTTYTAGSGLTLSGTEFGIADGGVIGKHLDDNCVMERNIAVGAVTSDKIPALAITTPKLADNAVTTIKMADDAVATRSIQNGAVTADKIAEGVIPESATTDADGLMSAADKKKLDGIQAGADKLPEGGTDGQVLTKTADGVAWEDAASVDTSKLVNYNNSTKNLEKYLGGRIDCISIPSTANNERMVTIGTEDSTAKISVRESNTSGVQISADIDTAKIVIDGTSNSFQIGDKSVTGITDDASNGSEWSLATAKAVKDYADSKIPSVIPVSQGGTGVTTEDALVQKIFNSASTPKASATQYGVVKFASDADFKAYMGIS